MMTGPEKSDLAIVAGKPAYKAEQSAAESVERRAGTKGNANQQSTCRTQSRISVSQALERIRQAFASDSVIHARSPTGRSLSDADNASSSTALSLRASGGVDMPVANAALMVFHIPMRERYIASLQGATAASLGLPELRPLPHRVTILPRQRPGSPQFSALRPVGVSSTGFAWATAASHAERPV